MEIKHERERLASITSHWAMVDGWRMHYRMAGRGEQSVVLVHRLTVSGNYLMPTAAELLKDFTVYVPDLPGFGASEKPLCVLGIPELAETLKAWMDIIGLDRPYLLGNSLGCHTIASLTAHHTKGVAGTVLVSPVGDPGGRNTPQLVVRALNDFVREPKSLWAVMFQDFLQAGLRRTILTLRSLQQCRLEAWLPEMFIPTLVIRGGRDRIVPRWWIDKVIELLPDGQAAEIQDAAHVPNFSHPARLAALLRAFVISKNSTGR